MHYNVVRTEYADGRIQGKLEYIRRKLKNEQAIEKLNNTISVVERKLSNNAKFNHPHISSSGEEYRYAFVNVGEGYYLLYQIEGDTVFVIDCLHKRELKESVYDV